MVLEARADPFEVERLDLSARKTTQWGLPIETQVICQLVLPTSSGWSITAASLAIGMRGPLEDRDSHVHRGAAHAARRVECDGQGPDAVVGVDAHRIVGEAAVVDVLGDAADAVAAHLPAAAVGVVHLHATIGVGGRADQDQAVRPDAVVAPGHGARDVRRVGQIVLATIDVDVVVADAVHLGHADDGTHGSAETGGSVSPRSKSSIVSRLRTTS